MQSLIRLIIFIVIIFTGAQNIPEICVHLSASGTEISTTENNPLSSSSQALEHDCLCSPVCNLKFKINNEVPLFAITSLNQFFQSSYPEKHLLSHEFSSLLIKPPIA